LLPPREDRLNQYHGERDHHPILHWNVGRNISYEPVAHGSPARHVPPPGGHTVVNPGRGHRRELPPEPISHFDEAHFDQGPNVVRTNGRQFCPFAYDIAQHPAEVDSSLET
jgi:hypothetical protein